MTEPKTEPRPASYSTADVARRLGVSTVTIQRWVDAGHLKAWKTVGGHRRIAADSADELFRTQQPLPAGAGAAEPGVPAVVVDAQALSVVIVDDNPDDRDLLFALVKHALPQAAVTLADNGFQGLVAIGRIAPDIVITDIVMPKMDGFELLRELADHCAVRPRVIVAASSLPPRQIAERGSLPAGVHFLAKPLDPAPFAATIRAALRQAGVDVPVFG